MMEPSPQARLSRVVRIAILGLVTCYIIGFCLVFMADPLGRAPVLDARENVHWAQQIAEGSLPAEPFYRALLYPYLLSFLAERPAAQLIVGTGLGFACHALSAILIGGMAARIWSTSRAGWVAGVLYAIYPVALFFAGQLLDITFATTLFLGGLYALLRSREKVSRGAKGWIVFCVLAGSAGALAVLARPNFLPPVLLFPLLAFGMTSLGERKVRPGLNRAALVVLPMALLFLAQGLVNKRLSGEFRIMPWQGAYNLYAANREGANGKFYKQRVAFDAVPAGMNTTRMESEYLYREAVGPDAPMEVDAMGRHWRAQLLASIAEDPGRWLGLMGRKVVYLFNDWEQYNNLTYAYHKERFPLLQWNPLGWGLLLLGAAGGLMLGWKRLSKAEAAGLGLCALAYAAGVLLFFVSARFRLPLAPLLCVFCGGLVGLSWDFLRRHRSRCLGTLAVCVGVAVLSYGNWLDARNRETFIQDEILLANAALRSGQDAVALDYANKALARDPDRQDARRLQVSALFNLWLLAEGIAGEPYWDALVSATEKIEQADAMTWFVRGVIAWRTGDRQAAVAAWREGLERYGGEATSCARALQVVGEGGDVSSEYPDTAAIRALLER
jgi:hypothetical protein